MPIHDWTRVPAGLFHHFHQDWTIELARALNRGRLPKGVAALVEQRIGPREADVLGIERRGIRTEPEEAGIATLPPPVARIVRRTEGGFFFGPCEQDCHQAPFGPNHRGHRDRVAG